MLYAIVAVIALILDQAMKYWTTAKVVLDTGIKELIPGFIHIANVHNTGAAFSFLQGARWFFVILCVVFVALIIYVLAKNIISTPVARWMAVMVMAGAIGNCIDRVLTGYVVDMFEFEFMTFPVFNIADIYITVCGIIFCLCVLLEKDGKTETKKAAVAGPRAAEKPAPDAPAPKAAQPRRKKQPRTVIPDFPKHPHPDDNPNIDPNDPFAEWERRAAMSAAAEKPSAPARPAAPVEKPAQEAAPRQRAAAPEADPVRPAVAEKAPAPKPVSDEPSFDLDDILAEFKDN